MGWAAVHTLLWPGLQNEYTRIQGPHAFEPLQMSRCLKACTLCSKVGHRISQGLLAGARLGASLSLLLLGAPGRGQAEIAEDRRDQWYGQRGVQWVRLQHRHGRSGAFLGRKAY